ncbi:MAG: family 16 glycoside hydrolase [Pirellulales bacterium]
MLRFAPSIPSVVLALACLVPAAAADPAAPGDLLRAARRIAVLGDSITQDGRWVADLTAWMEDRGLTADVINVGLGSETVSGLSEEGHAGGQFPRPDVAERLDRVLRVVTPDLVLAMYGMNCGIYQPLDEGRFAKFKEGVTRLHDAVEKTGARIIHLTPPVYDRRPDNPGPAGAADYDAVLAAYSDWLLSKRADGWSVIDVHGPMKAALTARRVKEPGFTFAADCVHPDDEGHWAICRAVLAGVGDDAAAGDPDLPQKLGPFLPEVTERMHLLRDAYREAAGHARPGTPKGPPIGEAEDRGRRLTESLRRRRLQLRRGNPQGVEWQMAIEWPRPKPVDAGPAPEKPAPVPADAVVLFDGADMSAWHNGENWAVADGFVTVGRGQIVSKQGFGDCQVHVEFRTPSPAKGMGQGRGNSGIFLMGKYEIQVLDSFEDGTDGPLTYPDGQCGALYKQRPPAVNACRPPSQWQTYDILFTRPRFTADGTLDRPGRVSVLHNGIAIHSDAVILGTTKFDSPPSYERHGDQEPLAIQDHGDPVQFRSIWVRPFEPLVPKPLDR